MFLHQTLESWHTKLGLKIAGRETFTIGYISLVTSILTSSGEFYEDLYENLSPRLPVAQLPKTVTNRMSI